MLKCALGAAEPPWLPCQRDPGTLAEYMGSPSCSSGRSCWHRVCARGCDIQGTHSELPLPSESVCVRGLPVPPQQLEQLLDKMVLGLCREPSAERQQCGVTQGNSMSLGQLQEMLSSDCYPPDNKALESHSVSPGWGTQHWLPREAGAWQVQ